jgi:hypothetical protein
MMNKRDLKADLELCNKATQGPWRHEWTPDCSEVYAPGVDKPIVLVGHDPHDAEFIVQAREGWPHAIERAIKAEALAQKLLDVLGRVIPNHLVGRLELDLDSVPEATVVRGEWNPIFKGSDTCECSVCKEKGVVDSDYGFIATPFCPNCGAKMEGGVACD